MKNFLALTMFSLGMSLCADSFDDLKLPKEPMTKPMVAPAIDSIQKLAYNEAKRSNLQLDAKNKVVNKDDLKMNYTLETFGKKPKNGWPVVISLHGGGTCPKPVNDGQWRNQQHRYRNAIQNAKLNCKYVTPRAPRDQEPWHPYFFPALEQLIEQMVFCEEGDPNHIYVMGYSEGGYACFRIMPSLMDKLAGIAPGGACDNPSLAPAENLFNIYFNMQLGGLDDGFKRITFARAYANSLKQLQQKNPGYYNFDFIDHKNRPHDCPDYLPKNAAIPKMLRHARNPFPKMIVWNQGGWKPAEHFYWLSILPQEAQKNKRLTAKVEGQTISIASTDYSRLTLHLSDDLINLDQDVKVLWNGTEVFSGKVQRLASNLVKDYKARRDLGFWAPAHLSVSAPKTK